MVYRLAFILSFCSALVRSQGTIATIAGGNPFQVTGIGGPATNVPLGTLSGIAADLQGNVYAVDITDYIVVKIATNGVLTVVAGNGTANFTTNGDGGLATNASFQHPNAIAVDTSGNIILTDGPRVRKVTPQGIITTVAGSGKLPLTGYSGDGGPATQASLDGPVSLATDTKGNLYLADSGLVLKVNAEGIISTVAAGRGQGLAVDKNGVLYTTSSLNQVSRVNPDGTLTVVAGSNGFGYSGDGGPATAALLNAPTGLAIDSAGDLYIADTANNRIREVTPDGIIRTGTGSAGFSGDQGAASLATLLNPAGVAVDLSGNLYVSDSYNGRVRRVDPAGIITTYAGNGSWDFAGEGTQARQAVLNDPTSVVVDQQGNVYFSDTGNNRVRKISPNGVITTVAGGSTAGFAGDGGAAAQSLLFHPLGLALDTAGNLYIADSDNGRVRRVDTGGTITTVAGNGATSVNANTADGIPAVAATLLRPTDVATDTAGNLYIAVGGVRKVSPDGTITTLATFQNALIAESVTVDAVGDVHATVVPLFFCFTPGQCGPPPGPAGLIRIFPDGTTAVVSAFESKVVFDPQGNYYAAGNNQVYHVSPSGVQTSLATATAGGLALDVAGNLYFANNFNNSIQEIFLNPATGLLQPALQTTLQPGYYIATVTLGQSQQPGYWGMQVLAPAGVLAGGLNLGGTIQQSTKPPGFGGVYLPTAQSLHVHIDAQAADASGASAVALGMQILDASNNPATAEQFGGTSLDFTQPLNAGYYTIVVPGGANSPNENFQMALGATYFQGGVDVGGFASPNSVGFGAFYLTAAQQVNIQIYGQRSYGASGAGGLRLTLYDANRNVIATVP